MIEGDDPFFQKKAGFGKHEVVIDTDRTDAGIADLSADEIGDILRCFRDRICDIKRDKRIAYVQVFKNHGQRSGATIRHSHSQIIALPEVPPILHQEIHSAIEYYEQQGSCIFCDLFRAEEDQKKTHYFVR